MKYMLLLYANESDVPKTAEEIQAAAPAWRLWGGSWRCRGVRIWQWA